METAHWFLAIIATTSCINTVLIVATVLRLVEVRDVLVQSLDVKEPEEIPVPPRDAESLLLEKLNQTLVRTYSGSSNRR